MGEARTTETAERMASAATDLLAALDSTQQTSIRFPFPHDDERTLWFYTPTDHGGVPLSEMSPGQQQKAHRLVASGLSTGAYVTASTIMGLENALDAHEGWRTRFVSERGRDPARYYVSVFGEPGARAWGWRFGGHHISLNYTILDGALISPTPTFFGADPAESQLVGRSTLRPLAGETDVAFELVRSLTPEQRAQALISPVPPLDLVQGNRARVEDGALPLDLGQIFRGELPEDRRGQVGSANARMAEQIGLTPAHLEKLRYSPSPKGVPARALDAGQADGLRELIGLYLDRMPDEVAAVERQRIAAVFDQVHFAWAGGTEPRGPHYYRLQGPRFLIEYDNTQRDANHIHSAWRDPEADFGRNLLAEHYAAAH